MHIPFRRILFVLLIIHGLFPVGGEAVDIIQLTRTNEQYEAGDTNLLWDIEVRNNSDIEPSSEPYYDICTDVYLYDFYSSSAPRAKELPGAWLMSATETARTNYWTVHLNIINDMFFDYAIWPGYSLTFSILSSMPMSNSHIFVGACQGQGELNSYGLQPLSEFQGPTGAVPPSIVVLTNVGGVVTTRWMATEFELSGTANEETIGTMTWSNEFSGAWGELPAATNWQFTATNLLTGWNRIVIHGTSAYTVGTTETEVLRPPRFWVHGPTSLLETATGRYECVWQDTNVAAAATWSLAVSNPAGCRLRGSTYRAGILPEGSNSQTARIRADYHVEGMDTNAELDVEVQTVLFTSWIPDDGLVGYWPLDGDARDLSSVANSGVVHGALTYPPGRFGQAGQFDHPGGKYIEVAHRPAYVFSNAFTISYWYKCTNGVYGRILQKHFPQQHNYGNCWEWMTEADNNVNFSYAWPGGGGNYDVLRTTTIQSNWTHYLITYTTNDNLLRIYIDGTERTNKTPVITLLPMTTTLSLTFMFDRVSWMNDAEGLLDDVAMWDRALSADEVAKVFAGTKPPVLWVTGEPEAGGEVLPYGYGASYLYTAPAGTITAQASPALNYQFTNWSGVVNSTNNPCSWVVTTSQTLTAYFASQTLVVLYDFYLQVVNGRVSVCWQTASEEQTVGCDLFRWEGNAWVKVNDALIPGSGDLGGNYSVPDSAANASDTFRYKLVEQEAEGRQEYGPFDVSVRNPRMEHIAVTEDGVVLRWLSRDQDTYEVQKTSDLRQGFESLATGLPATPPINVFTDQTTWVNGACYRVRVEE